ncbi:WD40-repeat-containing domain protein [Chytriomyces sp. MP71]|nr:WD40-repeat-containing domain protein [Chytriomyces sp. MP71]
MRLVRGVPFFLFFQEGFQPTTIQRQMRFLVGDEVGLVKHIDFHEAGSSSRLTAEASLNAKDHKITDRIKAKGGTPKQKGPPFTVLNTLEKQSRAAAVEFLVVCQDGKHAVAALRNGTVVVLVVDTGVCTAEMRVFAAPETSSKKPIVGNKPKEDEHFVGLFEDNGTIITCTSKGNIQYHPQLSHLVTSPTTAPLPTVQTNINQDALTTMKVFPQNPHYLATAGIERELCLWKATTEGKLDSVWKAKNVPNNYLDMRMPVHVTDIAFVPVQAVGDAVVPARICISTLFKHFRAYDISGGKRQPVVSVEAGEMPLKRVAVSPDGVQAVVTDTTGTTVQLLTETGARVGAYKGFAGAVTAIALVDDPANDGTPLLVTAGMDRFLRIYERDGKRRLLHKVYLKHRLHALAVDVDFVGVGMDGKTAPRKKVRIGGAANGVEVDADDDDNDEDFWARMQTATASDNEDEEENGYEGEEVEVEKTTLKRIGKGNGVGVGKKPFAGDKKRRRV